jgi:hypothetical protein
MLSGSVYEGVGRGRVSKVLWRLGDIVGMGFEGVVRQGREERQTVKLR